jgi:hypothetical protein
MGPYELRNYLIHFAFIVSQYQPWILTDRALDLALLNKKSDNLIYVLQKVALVNSFYQAGLRDIWEMATFICANANEIDEAIANGDVAVVETIRWMGRARNPNQRGKYSFASKYVHCHNPIMFPIFDQHVERVLPVLQEICGFVVDDFTEADLLIYQTLREIIDTLTEFTDLGMARYRAIDHALWLWGKYDLSEDQLFHHHPDVLMQIQRFGPPHLLV